ncbi:MAG TPA: CDP-alcohol phosphatidyltransferase family protein [Candidatus Fimenecus stercoravium]|nr:CDP-alcohol phosphatidyltransferase family protein [Candidatus Fimenecus stercoravium]
MKENLKALFSGCLTVPNLLSLIRILLIPVFGVLFYNGEALWAVVVLVLSGLTDLFDGKIARRFNQISELGKILDPVADKLTQITIAVVIFLVLDKSQDPTMQWFKWVFLFFLFKELVMILGGAVMLAIGLRPGAAEIYGKVATFVFYGVMVVVLAFGPEIGALREWFTLPTPVMIVLVIISAALTFVALLSYLPSTFRQFKERKHKSEEK